MRHGRAFQKSMHWRTLAVSTLTKNTNRQHFIAPKMIEYRPDDSDDYCFRSLYGNTILNHKILWNYIE